MQQGIEVLGTGTRTCARVADTVIRVYDVTCVRHRRRVSQAIDMIELQ